MQYNSLSHHGPYAHTQPQCNPNTYKGARLEGLVAGNRVMQRLEAHVGHVCAADALCDPLSLPPQACGISC